MSTTTINHQLVPLPKLHVYAADISDDMLYLAVEDLCDALIKAHTWHLKSNGEWYRFTDADQLIAKRRFEDWRYFAVKVLRLRADGESSGSNLTDALGDDCVTAGLLIRHHELGYVEPDYHERDATNPRPFYL